MREMLGVIAWPASIALIFLGAVCLSFSNQETGRAGYFELAGLPAVAAPVVAAHRALISSAVAAEGPAQQQSRKPDQKRNAPRDAVAGPAPSKPADAVRRAPGEPGFAPPPAVNPSPLDGMLEFSRGDRQRKVLALTLDDGPRPEAMAQVLPILAQYKVKATFFFVGKQAALYPELVRQVAQAGHEIGNHTYDHLRLPKLSDQKKSSEIDRCENLLWSIIGKEPLFMRPPGCELDRATRRVAHARGVIVAMYDVNLRDDGSGVDPQEELRSALARIRPGSVILGHSASPSTQAILPQLLRALLDRGYTFVTLSELAEESVARGS
jgi:peptidoglycan-N-acetylglucosamine deacetylase